MMDAREKWLKQAMQLASIFLFEGRRNDDATPMLKQAGDNLQAHLRTTPEGFALVPVPEWVKVADGLPVVPEGEKGVYVWVWNAKGMTVPIETFMTQQVIGLVGGYTHWQYRQDDTPAPPEDL